MSSGQFNLAAKLKTKRGYLTNQVSHLIKRPELLFTQSDLSTKQVNNNKAGCMLLFTAKGSSKTSLQGNIGA